MITEDDWDVAFSRIRHEARRIRLALPELLDDLAALAHRPPPARSPDRPFVLSAGERRAFSANTIIRDPSWRRRGADGALRISPADAESLRLAPGDHARVTTSRGSVVVTVEPTDRLQPGHVSLPNGFGLGEYPAEIGGVPPNELTATEHRDPWAGVPYHKHVPALVERVHAGGLMSPVTSLSTSEQPAPQPVLQGMGTQQNSYITTNDGVRIHYTDAGSGPQLLFIPGFSQSAAEFGKQIDDLSHDHRVIAMDLRGHGESEKPNYGYRVARLAADLRDLLAALDLRDVTLVGHSLGCTVIWAYWDLFGGERITRLVLIDQAPITAADLAPAGRAEELGGIFTAEMAAGIVAGLRGPDPVSVWKPVLGMMHTSSLSGEDLAWIATQNALFPPEHAATLYLDHYGNDWRDVLPRITVPTLVLGGEASFFAISVAQWVAAQLPRARLRIFSAAEKGSHLMFWENPELFNAVVREFLAKN